MKKVLITGISGFIAQHCAAQLLIKGYVVKGSIRNKQKKEEIKKGFIKNKIPINKLEFCNLDLLSDEGWEQAMQDCDYVFHIASPYNIKVPNDENKIIKPAVEGTLRALKFAKKARIKRLILTSSIVAMMGKDSNTNKNLKPSHWTNLDWHEITPYIKSKTLSELAAWDFIKNQNEEYKLELSTIHPAAVYGPSLTENLNGESMSMIVKLIKGKIPLLPKTSIAISDVRDVALAHVLAIEKEKAKNKRFIVASNKAYSIKQLAEIIKKEGFKKVSLKTAPSMFIRFIAIFNKEAKGMIPFIDKTISTDNSQTKDVLDWEPIEVRKTIIDAAHSVKSVLKT
jgi:dihydroflavonol-4-reductase